MNSRPLWSGQGEGDDQRDRGSRLGPSDCQAWGSLRQLRHPTERGTVTAPGKMADDLQRPLVASTVRPGDSRGGQDERAHRGHRVVGSPLHDVGAWVPRLDGCVATGGARRGHGEHPRGDRAPRSRGCSLRRGSPHPHPRSSPLFTWRHDALRRQRSPTLRRLETSNRPSDGEKAASRSSPSSTGPSVASAAPAGRALVKPVCDRELAGGEVGERRLAPRPEPIEQPPGGRRRAAPGSSAGAIGSPSSPRMPPTSSAIGRGSSPVTTHARPTASRAGRLGRARRPCAAAASST